MPNNYIVNCEFKATRSVEVEAESAAQAIEIAQKRISELPVGLRDVRFLDCDVEEDFI